MGGGYTLLYFCDLTSGLSRKILYCPAFMITFSTFCRLSLSMWLLTLAMLRGPLGTVMFISSELEKCPQAEIRENNEPKAQREKSVVQAKTPGNNVPGAQRKIKDN